MLDTARRLEALPETAAAARRGELSAEQTCAIADAAGANTAAEHDLLEAARRSPLAELREQCARTKATASVDLEARRRRIHQRRSLRSFTDAEGEWHLHCRNNPEVGARIMAALDSFREEVFRQARAEARHEPPDAYAADALAEMARQSCDGGGSGGAAETADAADDDAGPTPPTPAPPTTPPGPPEPVRRPWVLPVPPGPMGPAGLLPPPGPPEPGPAGARAASRPGSGRGRR